MKTYIISIMRNFPFVSYHNAFVMYILFMIIWFWPFLFGGQVIAADFDNTVNNNVRDELVSDDIPYISRNFVPDRVRHSDYAGHYIPDAHQSIKNDSYHWINTWVADYGFGSQLLPLQRGLSPVYFPAFVVSLFTENPYVFTTWMHMILNILAGFVFIAYMKLIRVQPLAALFGGITYATLPLFTYWATQNPFKLHAVWFIVLLYLLHRLVDNQRWWWVFLLIISIQSTILTVYLQSQVFMYTILVFFVGYLVWTKFDHNQMRVRYMMIIGGAGFIGLLMSMPVLIDFLYNVSQGLRVPLPASKIFRLPIEEPQIILGYFIPEVFSIVPVPIARLKIINFYVSGYYITLLITLFATYAIIADGKRHKFLLSGILAMMLISFEPTLGYLYNQYMSVGISSWATMFAFFGPILLVILSTFGVNHLIDAWKNRHNIRFEMIFSVLITGTLLNMYIRTGIEYDWEPRWVTVGMLVVVLMIMLLTTINRISLRWRSWLFMGAVVWATVSASFLAIPRMPLDDVAVVGDEVAFVKSQLGVDEYVTTVSEKNFSQMGWKCCLFLGNRNATYDIRALGVDTLLPQKRYQMLMSKFGYDIGAYDRLYKYKHYFSITPQYDSLDYWMMNIGLVVSKEKQNHPSLTYLQTIDTWHFYDTDAKGCCLQLPLEYVPVTNRTPAQLETTTIDPRSHALRLQKDIRYTDYFEIPLETNEPSVVVISQQYHKQWDAYALVNGQWQSIDTFAMNGVYQGAITPTGATRVRFDFTPWTLWMWIPHLIWLVGGVACVLAVWYPLQFARIIDIRHRLWWER